MTITNQSFKYALPRAEEYLKIVCSNIIGNLRRGNTAKLNVQPLLQRAYTLVNEIGVIPYKDYEADTKFLGDV
jgi:hypothetical protein